MLAKHAIEPVSLADRPSCFISQLFLRPKKDGGWRPVFNLRRLNSFVRYEHFKMEGLFMLKGLLTEGAYLAKIDLKDAYFTIPIAVQHRRFLCFEWNHTLFQFKVMPFGLSSAPRNFTKLLKPILAFWRRQGIRVIVFLDDILIINSSADGLRKDVHFCVTFLQIMGFVINFKKSALEPAQRLEFLGMILDTLSLKLFVPPDKIADITALGELLLAANMVLLRDLSKFIGKVNATRMALLPSPLFCRHLQQSLIQGLSEFSTYDALVGLSDMARTELRSWLSEVWTWNGRNILPPQPSMTFASDASLSGWGAVCSDGRSVSGLWSPTEAKNSINFLELLASFLALKSFALHCRNCHIQIQSDNRTTVAYLNRLGGTRSEPLMLLALDLWHWCLRRCLTLEAVHVPGVQNTAADRESRRVHHSSDWQLNRHIFLSLNQLFGPFQIDLFASRHNTQLPIFFSWMLDPDAHATDAMAQTWTDWAAYAFPPFALIPRVLAKIQTDNCQLLLIAPVWPSQPWYPVLMALLHASPVLLPQPLDLLQAPSGDCHPLVQSGALVLAAWPVCGTISANLAFLQQQPTLSLGSSHQALLSSTTPPFESGIAGVLNDRLIHFSRL